MSALLAAAAVITLLVTQNTVIDDIPVTPIETQSVEFSEEIQEQMETTYSFSGEVPDWYFWESDYDYNFTYNGEAFSLPMKVSDFPMQGATVVRGDLSSTVAPGTVEIVLLQAPGGTITLNAANKSDEATTLNNCSITSITVAPWGSMDFAGPDGTKLGDAYSDFDGSNLPGQVEDNVTDGNGYIRVYDYIESVQYVGCIIYNYNNGTVNQIMILYFGE